MLEAGLVRPRDGSFQQECGAGVLELTESRGVIEVKAPQTRVAPLDPARAP